MERREVTVFRRCSQRRFHTVIARNEGRVDGTHPAHALRERLWIAFESLTPGAEPLVDDRRFPEQRAQTRIPVRALRGGRETTECQREIRIRLLHRSEQTLDQVDVA